MSVFAANLASNLVPQSVALPDTVDRCIRILRWTFRRDGETLDCELGLTGDAMSAFQRHAMIERVLIHDGWWLESFESRRIERAGTSAVAR